MRLRRYDDDGERGSAIVEFVFIALVVFLPLVYVIAGFLAAFAGMIVGSRLDSAQPTAGVAGPPRFSISPS